MRLQFFPRNQYVEGISDTAPGSPSRADAFNGNVLLIAAAACAVIVFFLFHGSASPTGMAARFSLDDSFYYYETAWQTKINGFVTFDSIHPSNGVHFFWFLIVLAAAVLAPSKIALLYMVYAISVALAAAVYAAIWRFGTIMEDRRRHLTLAMTLIWSAILMDRSHYMLIGMESTLHMAMLWGCLIAGLSVLKVNAENRRLPGNEFLVFTLFCVFVTWSRLDSALFSLALYSFVAMKVARNIGITHPSVRKYFRFSVIILAAGAAIQIGFYYYSGGSFIPISGLVKATGIGPEITAGPWERHLTVVFPFVTFLDLANPAQLAGGTACFLALLGYILIRAFRARPPLKLLYETTAVLGLAIPVYAAIVGSMHDPYWRWYLAPVFTFYMLAIGCAFHELAGAIKVHPMRNKVVAAIACGLVSLVLLVMMTVTYRPLPHFYTRAQVGLLLKSITAEDDVLASFNSGQAAFLSERRMINLDGLVNSREYFTTVFAKPDALIPYLRKNGVRYIVDYDFYWANDAVLRNSTLKYVFPMVGDFRNRIMYIRELTYPH